MSELKEVVVVSGVRLPVGSVGAAAANPIRANDNIRRAGRPACGKAWHGAPVRPGGGRSRGT